VINFSNNAELFTYLKQFEHEKAAFAASQALPWQIITVNDRLSRYLQQEYLKFAQLSVVVAPPMYSLDTWLQQLYEALITQYPRAAQQRLNHWQAQLLWAKAVPQQHAHLSIQLMEEAYQAYGLLMQYLVNKDALTLSHHEPSQLLYDWIHAYHARCQQLHVIDPAQFMQCIIELAETAIKAKLSCTFLPGQLCFIGFDVPTPYLQRLIDCLTTLGSNCNFFEVRKKEVRIQARTFKNSEEELQGMMQHVLTVITENPMQHIGCILPNPSADRHLIKQILLRLRNDYPIAQESIVNFSAGPCLLDYPLTEYVQHALTINPDRCTYSDFSLFLLSPYCPGGATEQFARAELDLLLRQQESYELNFSYVIEFIHAKEFTERCPIFLATLKKFIALQKTIRGKILYPSDWISNFDHALHILLSADQAMTDTEQSVLKKIIEIIAKLLSIDLIAGKLSYAKIIAILKRTFATTMYQPHNKFAKIHVMGTLEASGMSFDYVWIAGLHSNNWPASPIANSFLPIALQRNYNMPHANLTREFDFTQKITDRLLHCAHQMSLSMPQHENDEALLPSPFLEEYFNQKLVQDIHVISQQWSHIFQNRVVEYIEDNRAPEISLDNPVKTGSRIFELQAKCPFRAFANLRLYCQTTPLPTPGISARLRGNLIHDALEMIWKDLQSHATLILQSEEELQSLVTQKVKYTLIHYKNRYPCVFSSKIQSIEKNRLVRVIVAWLMYEKNRAPFTVLSLEHKVLCTIAGLQLSLKIDRIDHIQPDSIIIIDYKTGIIDMSMWFGERPENLQLPLYGLAYPQKLAALAFASVKPHTITFKGIASTAELLPDVQLDTNLALMNSITLEEQQHIWQSQLEQLAHEFCSGRATVTPLNDSVCKTCDLMHLCRIRQC